MRYVMIFFVLVLASCSTPSTVMTRNTFDDIQVGTPIVSLEEKIGEPYNVETLGYNSYEYEYVERINLHYGYIIENHYFLTITDGKVVGKRVEVERTRSYDLIYDADPNYPGYPNHPGF